MRIEAYNQVSQIYGAQKANRAKNIKTNTMGRDEVQISSTYGKDFLTAKKAVAEAPDVRADRVAELKERINSGNYDVDAGSFADKLLEKYQEAL